MATRKKSETMEEMADRLHPGRSRRTSGRGKTAATAAKDYGFGDPVIVSGRSSANASKQLDKANARKQLGLDASNPPRGKRIKRKGGTEIVGGGF